MTILKYKQVKEMKESEIEEKIIELRKELIKAELSGGKTSGNIKTKEIKKAIARLLTFKNTKSKEKNNMKKGGQIS